MPSLHFEEVGEERGRTVVFLHGFMGRCEDWAPLRTRVGLSHRGVFVDLPGHGRSLGPWARYDIEAMAEAVVRTLDGLGIEAAALVGYSMGGRVALTAAIKYPSRVSHIVLESASPGLSDMKARQERADLDRARAHELRSRGLPRFLEGWYAMPLFESLRRHSGFEEMRARRVLGDAESLAQVIEDASPGYAPDLWPHLPQVSQPCLLVAGALDAKYVDIMRRASEGIEGARLELASGCGHCVHAEQPRWFASLVLGFLA